MRHRMLGLIAIAGAACSAANADVVYAANSAAAVKDTWVWSAEDFSHGHWGELRANQTSAHDQRILIQFGDLSVIPANATINSARLELYRYDGFSSAPLTLDAHAITSAWAETVTHSTQPSYGAIQSSATITTNGWYYWDLTALVQAWADGATTNNGVAIYDHGTGFYQRFQSSDVGGLAPFGPSPPGAAFVPQLRIDYTVNPIPAPQSAMLALVGVGIVALVRRRADSAA